MLNHGLLMFGGYSSNGHNLVLKWYPLVPSQLNSRLGFINPGSTSLHVFLFLPCLHGCEVTGLEAAQSNLPRSGPARWSRHGRCRCFKPLSPTEPCWANRDGDQTWSKPERVSVCIPGSIPGIPYLEIKPRKIYEAIIKNEIHPSTNQVHFKLEAVLLNCAHSS